MVSMKIANQLMAILACTAGMTLAGHAQADATDLPGWDLVWNDEFDGTSLNTSDWEALNRQDSYNNEKQYYLDDQVSVANGLMTITATNQPIANKQYRSGLIRTWDEYTYGRWEVRANLPTTQGMWPAIWLLPRYEDWPVGGEIDIMENRGSNPYVVSSAFHYGESVSAHQYVWNEYSATEGGVPVNFHDSFHTYAVEWEESVMRFYVDDNLYWVVNSSRVPVPDGPMSLIINLAIGGDFGGDPDGSTVWPQTMEVDYVRYWQKATAIQGDITGDGFVGLDDLDIVLNEWNQGTPPAATTSVVLNDFNNVGLSGVYENWSSGTITYSATDMRVQAGDFGGGWMNLGTPLDATGQTTLEVALDVNAGNVADEFNIVLIDADGTERVYHFTDLVVGDDQILSLNLDDWSQDNAAGSIAGLDISALVSFHLQGTFSNGNPGLWMDLTFDNIALTGGTTYILEGDINEDGFVGLDDLDIILNHWNEGTPPSGSAIPEPGTLAVIGLGSLAMMRRRA